MITCQDTGRGRIPTGSRESSGVNVYRCDALLAYLLCINDCSNYSVFSLYAIDME